ncbi:MAG: hypothetical protein HUU03_13200 [Planctomycetaceae bacterium]|nr:hypothetical protein [Planctomycetota bacterium]NUO17389.1 hypothetical protein [Planctomycetaceae bacterium]
MPEFKGPADNSKLLLGRKILKVEQLSKRQCDLYGFDYCGWQPVFTITLDDGTELVPLRDPERNGPGVLEVRTQDQREDLLWTDIIRK